MKLLVLLLCFNVVLTKESKSKKPVFLSEYVKNKDFEGARKASQAVIPDFENVKGHSGYFTVNETTNSNLFFWYFVAENSKDAPVVVWLQGGPGSSSMLGLFLENGPFVYQNETMSMRELRWSKFSHLIYIDNPVGTGYSFTHSYDTDEHQVGKDLNNMIRQFFSVFDDLKNNELYITGESYAGKYVPAMAYYIHESNKESKDKLNLKGISIGDGLCDPINQIDYGDYLYQIGLIDESAKRTFIQNQNKIKDLTSQKKYFEAFEILDKLISGFITPGNETYFYNTTGFTNQYNYLHADPYIEFDEVKELLQTRDFKMDINVGKVRFSSGEQVRKDLYNNFMKSIKPWFEVLIENYRVLTYNGQLDIIVAYPLTLNFLRTVEWSGSDEYKNAQRNIWYVDSEIAGYYKKVKGFTEVLVRDAGHLVPHDQPEFAYDLISKFVNNLPM